MPVRTVVTMESHDATARQIGTSPMSAESVFQGSAGTAVLASGASAVSITDLRFPLLAGLRSKPLG